MGTHLEILPYLGFNKLCFNKLTVKFFRESPTTTTKAEIQNFALAFVMNSSKSSYSSVALWNVFI